MGKKLVKFVMVEGARELGDVQDKSPFLQHLSASVVYFLEFMPSGVDVLTCFGVVLD
jgi:hypothetical protein